MPEGRPGNDNRLVKIFRTQCEQDDPVNRIEATVDEEILAAAD